MMLGEFSVGLEGTQFWSHSQLLLIRLQKLDGKRTWDLLWIRGDWATSSSLGMYSQIASSDVMGIPLTSPRHGDSHGRREERGGPVTASLARLTLPGTTVTWKWRMAP